MNFTFTAGVMYWIGCHTSGTPTLRSAGNKQALSWSTAATHAATRGLRVSYAIGSAPVPFPSFVSSQTNSQTSNFLILFRVA